MSADNWTTCPACKAEHEAIRDREVKAVQESYGKVSAEEYVKRLRSVSVAPEIGENLREDYEIGIADGVFEVSYQASCYKCNRGFKFTHKQEAKLTP